jgi:hypothetical protein
MSKVIITITDEDTTTGVNVDFGEGGVNSNSSAHYMAYVAVEAMRNIAVKEGTEVIDEPTE